MSWQREVLSVVRLAVLEASHPQSDSHSVAKTPWLPVVFHTVYELHFRLYRPRLASAEREPLATIRLPSLELLPIRDSRLMPYAVDRLPDDSFFFLPPSPGEYFVLFRTLLCRAIAFQLLRASRCCQPIA